MLSSAKDGLKIKAPSVYWIPYECGKFYIGQTGTIKPRCKEHRRYIRLHQHEILAVEDHSISTSITSAPTEPSYFTENQDTRIAF